MTTERLIGGITACVDRITVRAGTGPLRHVVLRRWTDPEMWTDGLIEREAAALHAVRDQGIAAPRLLGSDATGQQAGVRALLMTELPGRVLLAPPDLDHWLARLARSHADIHAMECTLSARSDGWFDPQVDLGWIHDRGLRRDALVTASTQLSTEHAVLVHGDYQHFNIL
nr:phosphotransferase [Pseudonocardia spinosispora]